MTKNLAKTATAVALAAVAGSVASADTKSRWYARLEKPAIQPPASVFPIAWTLLYVDIAVTSAVVLDRLQRDGRDEKAAAYWRALAANLVLNAGWSWVFFKAHRLPAAIGVAGALAVSSIDLARRAARTGRGPAVALAPYAGWCSFATVLTAAIWRRNA